MLNTRNAYYLLATIGLIIFTLILDIGFITELKQEVVTKEADIQPSASTRKKLVSVNLLNAVDLPPVPALESTSMPVDIKRAWAVEHLAQHKVEQQQTLNTQTTNSAPHHSEGVSESHIQSQFDNMLHLDSQQLQLSFPRSEASTQRILNYMHKCIGIDLGALKDNSLMRLTEKLTKQSDIIRVASGAKTSYEQALVNTYAKGLPMVRIYPYWFDKTFAQYIANNLGGASLHQLSGEYQLVGQTLSLVNIMLNQRALNTTWRLANVQICQ